MTIKDFRYGNILQQICFDFARSYRLKDKVAKENAF